MEEVFTVYCYEDQEIKDVFATHQEAEDWIAENREGREDICSIDCWLVDFARADEVEEQ